MEYIKNGNIQIANTYFDQVSLVKRGYIPYVENTDLNVPELKALAKGKGIKGYSNMNKTELKKAIEMSGD